jgi:ADP-heptose:LPS heptosyltransferase
VSIHPGTSEFGAFKRWPGPSYAALADRLTAELDASVVVTWGPRERGVAEDVIRQMTRQGILGPQTRSVKDLSALLEHVDLFIGGDTGPMHIASAMGTPVVAIFGPKDPAIYGPYGEKRLIVRKDLPCSPCTKRRCDNPICMTSVTPDDVLEAARRALTRWPRSR